ncbi:MAG: hypothetical protein AB4042_20100 [Leptolyngbyaceae cyanobacterium]
MAKHLEQFSKDTRIMLLMGNQGDSLYYSKVLKKYGHFKGFIDQALDPQIALEKLNEYSYILIIVKGFFCDSNGHWIPFCEDFGREVRRRGLKVPIILMGQGNLFLGINREAYLKEFEGIIDSFMYSSMVDGTTFINNVQSLL